MHFHLGLGGMSKMRAAVVGLLVAALAVTASVVGTASAQPAQKALRIDLLSTFNGLPFYTATLCGARDAAKKLGGTITINSQGPPHGESVPEQLQILSAAVNSKPDGIVLVPADPRALVTPVKQAIAKGVPFTTTDQTLAQHVDLANFTANNFAGGQLGGKEMVRQLAGKTGTILVLDNKPGLFITNERARGFIAAITKAKGLKVLPTQFNVDDQNKAAAQVQATLTAHPDLVGIFATTEAGALGAVSALQGDTAVASKLKVIAYDADQVEVRALKAGQVHALVAQGSYAEGYGAATILIKHIRGQLQKGDYKYANTVPNVIVTKQNVNNPDVEKFLYPTKCSS